jgi:hypothetical protein
MAVLLEIVLTGCNAQRLLALQLLGSWLLPAMRSAFVGANSRRSWLKHEPDEETGCGRVAEHWRVRSRSKTETRDPM